MKYQCPTCNRRSSDRQEPSSYCQFCGAPLCPKCDPGPQEPCPNCICQWSENDADEALFVAEPSQGGCLVLLLAAGLAIALFAGIGCAVIDFLSNNP